VAANIVTVMVVAAAIIAVRSSVYPRPTVRSVLMPTLYVVFGVLIVVLWTVSIRHNRHPNDRYTRVFMRVMAVMMVALALATLVFLLILVGYAVGVK
jgi:hypothetical protein